MSSNKLQLSVRPLPAVMPDQHTAHFVYVREKGLKAQLLKLQPDVETIEEQMAKHTRLFEGDTHSPNKAFAKSSKQSLLVLSSDVFIQILSFTPIGSLPSVALVHSKWPSFVRGAIQFHKQVSKQYLEDGMISMRTSIFPHESSTLFKRAIETYPRLIEAYIWEGKAQMILNNCSGAVQTIEQALRHQPSHVETLKLNACILYANGDDQCASKLLEEAAQLEPSNASIYFELGFCYHGLGQFSEAIDCYTRALNLDYLRTFVVLANRADCFSRIDKIDEALKDANASLQLCPQYATALRVRACLFQVAGNPDAAYNDYTAIIEHATCARVKAETYCSRAFCYGDVDEADIDRAQILDPENVDLVQYKACALVARGNVHEAIDHITRWLACNEAHKHASCMYAFRGDLHQLINNWDASTRDLETAEEIERASADLLRNNGSNDP
jgi:tetratricopeptide (TPR) repeat protein